MGVAANTREIGGRTRKSAPPISCAGERERDGSGDEQGNSVKVHITRLRVEAASNRGALTLLMSSTVALLVLVGCSASGPDFPAQPSIEGSAASQLQEKWISDLAVGYGITDLPEVDVVTETSPMNIAQKVTECMRNAGYDAGVENGAMMVDFPRDSDGAGLSEQFMTQYRLDSYVCSAEYPLAGVYLAPLTEEQKEVDADYFLEELPACLTEQGIAFEAPPSREVYLSDPSWSPYTTAQIPDAKWDEVNAACPQSIAPERLWEPRE